MKAINKVASVCLLLSCIATQPVAALSVKATHAIQQREHSTATDNLPKTAEHLAPASSLNDFIPQLIGPHLYLKLLQSDQFITLQGIAESLWEKYIIKKP